MTTEKELKEKLKRDLASIKIRKKALVLEKKLEDAKKALTRFQHECPHYNSEYENKGNTGSWDRDDTFWTDWYCHDCGKIWTTDQSVKHPYAKRIGR